MAHLDTLDLEQTLDHLVQKVHLDLMEILGVLEHRDRLDRMRLHLHLLLERQDHKDHPDQLETLVLMVDLETAEAMGNRDRKVHLDHRASLDSMEILDNLDHQETPVEMAKGESAPSTAPLMEASSLKMELVADCFAVLRQTLEIKCFKKSLEL
ncbi:unnamed protein product [Cylicostephanus goldi]|uniref:Uncharacterized protein n=1 Tax=Cylicostephanus goldi TaxID=71465 RepID=A0A3P6R8F9_CYLGO|nr:unnamed protein product [Cylicostephanus goldi]